MTFFLSLWGMVIASPCIIIPSCIVSESYCPWYGHNVVGTSLMSLGDPVMIILISVSSSDLWSLLTMNCLPKTYFWKFSVLKKWKSSFISLFCATQWV